MVMLDNYAIKDKDGETVDAGYVDVEDFFGE